MNEQINKNILKTIGMVLILSIVTFFIMKKRRINKNNITIGILQTATHPALNKARKGFISHLKEKLGKSINFIIQNAEGSISNAHTIAKSFHLNKKINGICTIGTLATQVMANIEKKKPIFFTVVTSPKALNIIHPTTNCCGSTDMIDIKGQIEMIKSLLPKINTLGIIFNISEINSQILVKKMIKELNKNRLLPRIIIKNDLKLLTFYHINYNFDN